MADPNTRQGKRTPVTLKIKFKSETLEQFIERYAVDVSQGGIFIRTKEPLAVGTQMKFEFQLRDASPLIAGEGTVVWTRENDPSRPAIAPGMGVRFDRLADGSQAVLERILAEKAKQAPGRAASETAKPPLFTDTPTKVAPAPVQEALGLGTRRPRTDSEQTPLPPPRPFHSDADEFDEKAFEEATKVRSLDELAAQTAALGAGTPGSDDVSEDAPTNTAINAPPDDELAARRAAGRPDTALAEPPAPAADKAEKKSEPAAVDRESAPGLPEPPTRASRPRLDSPTPRSLDDSPGARTNLESAKAARAEAEAPRAVSAELSHPTAPPKSSAASIVILMLVLVAGAAAAVWWFVLREKAVEVAQQGNDGSDTTPAVGSADPDTSAQQGSDDSAGSDGSAAAVDTPPAPIVDTVIAASVPKGATVEIVGTDQKGPAPFTAKLEKDKAYRARVTAPGFLAAEVDVTGGQDQVTAKLDPKPHVLSVTSDPPGAEIYVDNVNTRKLTPSEVELTPSQAAKSRVRVTLRRPGFRPFDRFISTKDFQDEEERMVTSVVGKLGVARRVDPDDDDDGDTSSASSGGTSAGSSTGSSSGSNAGSGTGTGGSGSGTDATPTPGGNGSGTTPPAGSGATGGSGTGGGSSGSGTGTSGSGTQAPPASGGGEASGSTSTPPTPSSSTGEPEPTWTK